MMIVLCRRYHLDNYNIIRTSRRRFNTISNISRYSLRKRKRTSSGLLFYNSPQQQQQQQLVNSRIHNNHGSRVSSSFDATGNVDEISTSLLFQNSFGFKSRNGNNNVSCKFFSTTNRSSGSSNNYVDDDLSQQQRQQSPMELNVLSRYLELQTYSKEELDLAFEKILSCKKDNDDDDNSTDDRIDKSHVFHFLSQRIKQLDDEYNDNDKKEERHPLQEQLEHEFTKEQTQQFLQVFHGTGSSSSSSISREAFIDKLTELATAVDYKRSWPITLSMLFIGISVGVTTPAMPFVIEKLQLTPGQYGVIVSAFGLSRMLGNLPSAVLVERYGRKPFLTYSLAPCIALSVGGIGFATSFEQLYALRLLTGLGVAALTTASQLTLSDISTPLNRASTLAPVMSAFSAGTTLGPAIGGNLVDQMGLHLTFSMVGLSYCGLAVLNQALLQETIHSNHDSVITNQYPWRNNKRKKKKSDPINIKKEGKAADSQSIESDSASTTKSVTATPNNNNNDPSNNNNNNTTILQATQDALGQWKPLFQQKSIRNILIINGCYWFAFSGSQITLLPLILTQTGGLEMTATEVGKVYMGMSLVQVWANPILARHVVDNVGKVPAIVAGCALISSSMGALPMAVQAATTAATEAATTTTTTALPMLVSASDLAHLTYLGPVLGVWALGSSMLSTAPLSYIADHVPNESRAQGLAMLRVSGDVGFLVGSASVGVLADVNGNLDIAMQCSGAFLFASTVWFATTRNRLFPSSIATTSSTTSSSSKSESKI